MHVWVGNVKCTVVHSLLWNASPKFDGLSVCIKDRQMDKDMIKQVQLNVNSWI